MGVSVLPLVLASGSSYRKELLARLGIPFECASPELDEDEAKREIADAVLLARTLAHLKAQEILAHFPGHLVIGADQVLELKGAIFSKPGSVAKAVEQLGKLAGHTHQLITAVCLFWRDEDGAEKRIEFENLAKLTMYALTPEEIRHYVATDNPVDCAGSYKIESAGIKLFEKIQVDDFTSIIGLPLIQLNAHLRGLGYAPLI